jgi:ABC-2 type transport system permease protein
MAGSLASGIHFGILVHGGLHVTAAVREAVKVMSIGFRIQQEFVFLQKSKAVLGAMLLLLAVSSISIGLGLDYVAQERQEIKELIELDTEQRAYKRSQAYDWGGAAYDAFHAAWNAPSDLTFAAIGQRDLNPTMMRIRALAVEGQIYETDSINPELALSGRFDFAFVIAYLLPLIVIFVFYDLVASERESGRLNLLTVSAENQRAIWMPRISLRILGILIAVLTPLCFGGLVEGTTISTILSASLAVLLQLGIWTALVLAIAMRSALRSESIASISVGVWVILTLAIPIAGKAFIENSVTGIKGAEVALVQREAVNDAWDLPKAATMEPFYASHPEWSDSEPMTDAWHWKWYYAFQQVGDESAADLAREYRETMLARDDMTAAIAWVSPAVAIQRQLEALAQTNLNASLAFEDQVRSYHEQIRRAYYPVLFREVPFSKERLAQINIPDFSEAAWLDSD